MKSNWQKTLAVLLSVSMLAGVLSSCSSNVDEPTVETSETVETTVEVKETTKETEQEVVEVIPTVNPKYIGLTAEEIVATLTLEEKANQMVQGALYNIPDSLMQEECYGSILSTYGGWPATSAPEWIKIVNEYQKDCLSSSTGIPYIYGNDSVHGVNTASGTVIFPHNINIGAANDAELTYEMGVCVGSDILYTGMIMNFAPCVAAAQDPRWGRTYESYSSEPEIITPLAVAFAKGQLNQGIIVCAKHFVCDGYAVFGTGEGFRIIDRGDAIVSDDVINENLDIYQALIDEDIQMIMISHSALNGIKMHENKTYIEYLKNDMGFEGVVLSDWDSLENCSGDSLEENVVLCVNAGVDMLMEADKFGQCAQIIVDSVNNGDISMERVDDAVTRIIKMKLDCGIFEDPYFENIDPAYDYNSDYGKEVAFKLAQESFVPLKADGGLTIEPGSRVFVLGPAADDMGVMCGGWTVTWQGSTDDIYDTEWVMGHDTILEALEDKAEEYDLTIVTDINEIDTCDVILLCVGEIPYAEWEGDTEDLSLVGNCGLYGNEEAIAIAKESGIKTITLIIAGRNVLVSDYIDDWDSCIMCYLPGTEGGRAVASSLMGESEYTGTLPMPYYASTEDIDNGKVLYPVGFSAVG